MDTLNISYPSYSRGNYTPEKAERKLRKKKAPGGRSFLNLRNYSFAYSSQNKQKHHLAASVRLQPKIRRVSHLHLSDLRDIYA